MADAEPWREIAGAILVGACGRLLLQQRDDVPGILYPGMLGLFGGHREGGETPLETVRREILEETGIDYPPGRFVPFARIELGYAGGSSRGTIYVVRDATIEGITVTEGSPRITAVEELPGLLARTTPMSCAALRLFIEAQRQPQPRQA